MKAAITACAMAVGCVLGVWAVRTSQPGADTPVGISSTAALDAEDADRATSPKRPFKVIPDRLSVDFRSNEIRAKDLYDRIFTIDGFVSSVADGNEELERPPRVTLRTDFPGPDVKADLSRDQAVTLHTGDHVFLECDTATKEIIYVVAHDCSLVDHAPYAEPPAY